MQGWWSLPEKESLCCQEIFQGKRQSQGMGPSMGEKKEKECLVRVRIRVCVCVYDGSHLSWSDLNPPQPEIAPPSASLAQGGVPPLWNMIPRTNIPAACQLCCKLLAHGFPCLLIIRPVWQSRRHFSLQIGPLPPAPPDAVPCPHSALRQLGTPTAWPPVPECEHSLGAGIRVGSGGDCFHQARGLNQSS